MPDKDAFNLRVQKTVKNRKLNKLCDLVNSHISQNIFFLQNNVCVEHDNGSIKK